MAFGLDAAPLAPQHAVAVDHECTALDAAYRLAVKFLFLDYAKLRAQLLLRVGKQCEWQLLLGLKIFVRPQAVARDAGDDAAGVDKLGMEIAKLLRLRRAAGRAVLGVELEDHGFPALLREAEQGVAGGRDGEVCDGAVEHWRATFRSK